MTRLIAIDPTTAQGEAKALLEGVQAKLGLTPNLMRTFANSPAVLKAYLGFSGALQGGALSVKLREQVALTVSELNRCGYCLGAHTALGHAAGLNDQAILDARRGQSPDRKTEAALRFSRRIVATQGFLADADLQAVREAGFTEGEIAELVANVALTIFTNVFNHVAQTEEDFPAAPPLAA